MDDRRILVLDDEAIFREFVSEILSDQGYMVECASEGKEAIKRYTEHLDSGYSNDPIMYEQYGFKGVVMKPFHGGTLFKLIDRILKA